MAKIFIPKDAIESNEKAKKVIINGKMYSVPVGKSVEVPDEVATVITDWLENLAKVESEREERLENLDK